MVRMRIDPASGSRGKLVILARVKPATYSRPKPATGRVRQRSAMAAVRREAVMQIATNLNTPRRQHPRSRRWSLDRPACNAPSAYLRSGKFVEPKFVETQRKLGIIFLFILG